MLEDDGYDANCVHCGAGYCFEVGAGFGRKCKNCGKLTDRHEPQPTYTNEQLEQIEKTTNATLRVMGLGPIATADMLERLIELEEIREDCGEYYWTASGERLQNDKG